MANLLKLSSYAFILFSTAFFASELAQKAEAGKLGKEKVSHITLFWHDILNGSHPSSVLVIPAVTSIPNNTFGFGTVRMIDNNLTKGPLPESKLMGKAQGFYAMAGEKEPALLMVMNFAFTKGKFKGSTITVVGRNDVMSRRREMPVVGGTGEFRFCRGYVSLKTIMFDLKSGNAIVQYDAHVLHY